MRKLNVVAALLFLASCAGEEDAGSLGAGATEASGSSEVDIEPSFDELDYVDPADLPEEEGLDKIRNGIPVNGAGVNQQWEGIVHLSTSAGGCTGFFITDRHILTAGHCFTGGGAQNVSVRAPTWDGGAWHSFFTFVNVAGTSRSYDVAVVQLAAGQAWANSSRRFRLYTGSTSMTTLNIYGYGYSTHDGQGAGTLRTAQNRATIQLVDHADGWFKANAHTARICQGDSGGPAMKEGSFAIVWGIAHSAALSGTCASGGDTMTWTKINTNLAWVEAALGFSCARFSGDGQTYARCW